MQADLGRALVRMARGAIASRFGMPAEPAPDDAVLNARGATFVTLRQGDDLRGCIGTVTAWRPLAEDLRANAVAAAFSDPRFPPLTRSELADTSVEVSVLGAPVPMTFADEAAALAALRPGVDGVVLELGRRRATFLPQVWEQLPDPCDFMEALKHKAGLRAGFWSPDLLLSRYTVDKFVEDMPARIL